MNEKGVLVVVLGYGCHLTDSIKKYLDEVVKFTEANVVKTIITTGGFTNSITAPGISEADMMAQYLKQSLTTPIILEESSRSTNENLWATKKIIKNLSDYSGVIIFCDRCRKIKVKILAKNILKIKPKIITYDLTVSVVQKMKQYFIATPLDILSLKIPLLEKMELKRREKLISRG